MADFDWTVFWIKSSNIQIPSSRFNSYFRDIKLHIYSDPSNPKNLKKGVLML